MSLLVEHPFFQDCQFFILRGFPWGSIVASCSPASRRLLGHSACGIEEPKKEEKHKQKPDCAPCPAAELAGKPDQALPPLPDWAPPLDQGLQAALPTMNPRAVGFLLHTPKDQESEWKEQSVKLLENLGLDRLNRNWNSRLFQFHTNEKILQKVRT